MRRLLRYVRPYAGLVVVALVLLLVLSATQIAPPIIAKFIIDQAITPAVAGRITPAEGLTTLGILGMLYLAILAANAGVRYGQGLLTAYVGQRAMYDLRIELFRHLQFLPLSFFDRNPVGRLMTRITNDIDALTEMVSRGVVSIFGDVFILTGVMIAMILLDHRLAIVTFLALPVVIGLTAYFRGIMRDSFRSIRIRLARVNAYLNETLSGISVVQLFTREGETFKRFDDLNVDLYRANEGAVRAMSTFQPAINLTRAVTSAALFLAGGYLILDGQLTIGTLLAFWQLIEQFFRPILDLAEKYNVMQAAMASSERIFRLLDTPRTVADPPTALELRHVRGEVTFDHVWFSYQIAAREAMPRSSEDPALQVRAGPQERSDHPRARPQAEPTDIGRDWILKDVDFTISAGESVAIVGATGAGKTAIISLISRFYDVQRGRILLDGVDIRDVKQHDLRRHIGVVLQDPFIFAGTIASNIRLNDATISDERVRAAAHFVNADKFIDRLPERYGTVVTERGSMLSVGQKQLLAFARAIAFNPEILLVLDEATSSVDTETEHLIQDALAKLMRGRTSIVIAHRLSTIQNVDRIVVLHKGRVVEVGTHRELLAERGVYHRLYELQYRAHQAV
ncbi:MAG: ABC transporter ATP-binding protein [Chloroflexi bacterium]|nr:ABC transporter ATP-binding protein [Chloroflexota bacterium]